MLGLLFICYIRYSFYLAYVLVLASQKKYRIFASKAFVFIESSSNMQVHMESAAAET